MTLFSYTARTTDGQIERGTLEAGDVDAARMALAEMHVDPVELNELPENFTLVAEEKQQVTTSRSGEIAAVDPLSAPAIRASVKLPAKPKEYLPLTHTLRLYAGWLLAWYVLIYAFGSLQFLGRLPFDVPFLRDLFSSVIILQFTGAAFLFLFLTSVHRLLRGGILKGMVLTGVGITALVFFVQNA